MSAIPQTGGNSQTPSSEVESTSCNTSTILKASAFVVGLLMAIGATALYFYNVNAIAAYAVGGAGSLTMIGSIIASFFSNTKKKSQGELTQAHPIALTPKLGPTLVKEEESKKETKGLSEERKVQIREIVEEHQIELLRQQLPTLPSDEKVYFLGRALIEGEMEMVDLLLEKNEIDLMAPYKFGLWVVPVSFVFLNYPDENSVAMARKIFGTHKELLQQRGETLPRRTPLETAITRKRLEEDKKFQIELVKELLNLGADPSLDSSLFLATCFIHSSVPPSIEIIALLVDAGAKWDSDSGISPRAQLNDPNLADWREQHKEKLKELGFE